MYHILLERILGMNLKYCNTNFALLQRKIMANNIQIGLTQCPMNITIVALGIVYTDRYNCHGTLFTKRIMTSLHWVGTGKGP
jgi:hypothetical protein